MMLPAFRKPLPGYPSAYNRIAPVPAHPSEREQYIFLRGFMFTRSFRRRGVCVLISVFPRKILAVGFSFVNKREILKVYIDIISYIEVMLVR